MTEANKKLQGKIALVTGSARGIGAAIAVSLAKEGANIALNDLHDPLETIAACKEVGVQAISAKADVGDRLAVEAMVDRVEKELGPIDILVSNAVYSDRELFYQADLAGFERTIQVCMWGPYYLARAVANRMIPRGQGGSIVFISSPHAFEAIPGATAYNMAKAATDQLARTAAVELAEFRIRVNIIHPGWTNTPGERKFFGESELAEHGSGLPLGRLAEPRDIARGVTFLCDPESDYITGSTLTIDGGIMLPYQQMFRIKNRPS